MIYSITKKKIVELIMSEFQGGFREGGVEDGDKGSDAKKQELALQRQLEIQQAVYDRVEVAAVDVGPPTSEQVRASRLTAEKLAHLLRGQRNVLGGQPAPTLAERLEKL